MRLLPVLVGLVTLSIIPLALATHENGCVPGGADPSTYNAIAAAGVTVYVEERGVPAPANTSPPVPGSGFILGGGTFAWVEGNGVPGLQRGSGAPTCLPPNPAPCLVISDPVSGPVDENCGHGPDSFVF